MTARHKSFYWSQNIPLVLFVLSGVAASSLGHAAELLPWREVTCPCGDARDGAWALLVRRRSGYANILAVLEQLSSVIHWESDVHRSMTSGVLIRALLPSTENGPIFHGGHWNPCSPPDYQQFNFSGESCPLREDIGHLPFLVNDGRWGACR